MPPKQRNKNTRLFLTEQQKCTIRALHQEAGLKVHEIIKKNMKLLKNIPISTIYRHAKTPVDQPYNDRRIKNKATGRPRKLNARDTSRIHREVLRLRKNGTFSSLELQEACGMMKTCKNNTFRKHMRERMGLKYLVTRRKGLLTPADKKLRVKFAKGVIKQYGKGDDQLGLWREKISLFTDIVGFEYKVTASHICKCVWNLCIFCINKVSLHTPDQLVFL